MFSNKNTVFNLLCWFLVFRGSLFATEVWSIAPIPSNVTRRYFRKDQHDSSANEADLQSLEIMKISILSDVQIPNIKIHLLLELVLSVFRGRSLSLFVKLTHLLGSLTPEIPMAHSSTVLPAAYVTGSKIACGWRKQ